MDHTFSYQGGNEPLEAKGPPMVGEDVRKKVGT